MDISDKFVTLHVTNCLYQWARFCNPTENTQVLKVINFPIANITCVCLFPYGAWAGACHCPTSSQPLVDLGPWIPRPRIYYIIEGAQASSRKKSPLSLQMWRIVPHRSLGSMSSYTPLEQRARCNAQSWRTSQRFGALPLKIL